MRGCSMTTPVLVWHGGVAAWMDDKMADDRRLPRATCEICKVPATVTLYEEIDVTRPGDPVMGFMPGRQHQFCDMHRVEFIEP